MANFRVKIVGYGVPDVKPAPDETISVDTNLDVFKNESICDYNIVIICLRDVYAPYTAALDANQLDDYFNKPSVIICLSDSDATKYSWLPNIGGTKVVSKSGTTIQTTDTGCFNKLLNSYQWEWYCSFTKLPKKYTSIAQNMSGQTVAARADIGRGRVYIIPNLYLHTPDNKKKVEKYAEFLRSLIDTAKEEVEKLPNREKMEPDWVEHEVDSMELALAEKRAKLEEQYQTIKATRKLFYETGANLTTTVYSVMRKLGFNAELKEKEGAHDIEIREKDLNLIVEVTSSEDDWININKTRQLLDWCRRFERERSIKPKGILIVNHYCNHPPTERDEPFTKAALKQGENEDFCLMTTVQLYNIFCKLLKGETDKDKIKEMLIHTKGLLVLKGA